MDFEELLEQLRFEYWATLAADPQYQDNFAPAMLNLEDAPTFYDFLLSRGLNRYQLSAHGIGCEVQP